MRVRVDEASEAADRRPLVGKDLKDGEQLRDLQKVMNLLCKMQQLQLAAFAAHGRVRAYKLADSRAIDVVHVGKVQDNLCVAFLQQLPDRLAQHGTAIAERDAAACVHDHDCAGISGCEM